MNDVRSSGRCKTADCSKFMAHQARGSPKDLRAQMQLGTRERMQQHVYRFSTFTL